MTEKAGMFRILLVEDSPGDRLVYDKTPDQGGLPCEVEGGEGVASALSLPDGGAEPFDLAEQNALQHALERKRRVEALGMLAGGIAHDLNNILQPILINAELVFEALPEGSPERELLGQIIEAARLGKDITSQIKMFGSGGKGPHRPVAIEPLLRGALRIISRSLPPGIELRQAIEPTPSLAGIAPAQFHQLLANLCINAVQAMEGGPGILTVALAEAVVNTPTPAFVSLLNPGDYVKLSVSDTGCGIRPEALDRIFDPLFTAGKKSAGAGLGLGVVHAALRNAGGSVTVSSRPGEGASFEIYLPRQRPAPEEEGAAAPLPEPSTSTPPAGAVGQAMEKEAARGCP